MGMRVLYLVYRGRKRAPFSRDDDRAGERRAVARRATPRLRRDVERVLGPRALGGAAAPLHRVVRELRRRDDIVLVHDHQEAFGPTVLSALGPNCPPVLHTLHWDLRKHPELYGDIEGGGSLWVNGVSFSQLTTAPPALRKLSVGHVHLATPLAVGADRRPAVAKGEHLVVVGRVTPYKGQAVAARLAHRTGAEVVLAGPVGPYHRPSDL